MSCNLCPRRCSADRSAGGRGYCGYGSDIYISKAMLHMWEEPCISGIRGSGAVFFSGCSLGCIYCQNSSIALRNSGKSITCEELAKVYMSLQHRGAHNINLVTPTHFADEIIKSIVCSREKGLTLPIVYNTGGYELRERIAELRDTIDVYLTDFKYINPTTAEKYSKAPDYPQYVKSALEEMVIQHPKAEFDSDGLIQRGVIVRHLLLPGGLKNSKGVIEYLYKTYGDSIYISIMSQYTPVRQFDEYPELSETVSRREYEKLVDYALSMGVKNAYVQETDSSSRTYIPDFDEFTL